MSHDNYERLQREYDEAKAKQNRRIIAEHVKLTDAERATVAGIMAVIDLGWKRKAPLEAIVTYGDVKSLLAIIARLCGDMATGEGGGE